MPVILHLLYFHRRHGHPRVLVQHALRDFGDGDVLIKNKVPHQQPKMAVYRNLAVPARVAG
jgi:hypothetical protein